MIKITENLVIKVEENQYVLAKTSMNKKGEAIYSAVGYYGKLKYALERVVQILFAAELENETVDLNEALKRLERITDKVMKLDV